MSEKSEELIEKTNSTNNTVSKRTIKLPNSVTEKKKDVNSNAINNIIPIESLKEKTLISRKTKRTLHLNLGTEEIKEDLSIKDPNSITMVIPKISTNKDNKELLLDTLLDVDDNSPAITPSSVTSNKSFLDEPSVFEKFDININNKITSAQNIQNSEPAINLNSSFFYEPSVFEKYSIEISEADLNDNISENETIIEKESQKEIIEEVKEEPIINQNSIDNTEPLSLNDLISLDDETESIDDILTASTKSIKNEEATENLELSQNIQDDIDNIIDDEILLNDLDLLLDNEDTSADETLVSEENAEEELASPIEIIENEPTENSEVEDLDALISQQEEYDVIEETDSTPQEDIDIVNEIIDEDIGELIKEDNLVQSNDSILINELSNEDNDINLLDLVENDENLLKEVADNIKTPENNNTSAPVGIFIENSGNQKNSDSSLFSKAKASIVSNITSVFKKFSYDEAANLANSIDEEDDENIIQNVNTVSDIKQVLGNVEAKPQEKSVTELDVKADSIGFTTPTIDETILDLPSNENDINSLNILTPEKNENDFSDEELLDLLELDSSTNELVNSLEDNEEYENVENSIRTDYCEEISENDIVVEENSNNDESDDDDFSIEDYFGIEKSEDSNIVQEDEDYAEEFEENIDDLLDDDADIEFDEELSNVKNQEPIAQEPQSKMSGEELLSLSKLFDNLTNTISSLSNRISELENTKMQPVIIEPETIKQAIEQVAKVEQPILEDNNIEEENIIDDSNEESIIDTMIEDSIEQEEQEIEQLENTTDIDDISLDDIDLEDLSGLTISDVLNESNEESVDEVNEIEQTEQELTEKTEDNTSSEDINLDDINIDDIDLNDIDLNDITLDENVEELEQQSEDLQEEDSIENLLTTALSSDKNLDTQKEELLLELLSDSNNESLTPEENTDTNEEPTSDFIKIIDSLSKAISELEQNSLENPIIPENSDEKPISTKDLGIDSNKAFNILINKDDIFSISILNETYEIIADFDGISVLSENIHISTPKKNFFLKVGNKNIEIHNYKKYFLVYTTFEDVEFANAINNVTFAKKNGRIELNIKEAFKLSSTNNVLELSMLNTSIAKIPSTTQVDQKNNNDNKDTSICDNKTLVISEETQKVYLPYTINDVMEKLNNTANGYQTIDEVIEKEYVVPLSEFKMPIISRFKEAYRFMRVKEKSSVYEALDLALELMFNSNLNPAIIRAAKDLKELDIYLDCLYENELDKFDRFKIIYKVLPKVQN